MFMTKENIHTPPVAHTVMSPKKRKDVLSTSVPASKRRLTRSSTKAVVMTLSNQANTVAVPDTETTSHPASLAKRADESDSKSKTVKPAKQDVTTRSSSPSNVTTLTITHDLVKKPIQCHQYTPTSPSSTPSPTVIFTHGAGGTLSADAVVHFCTGFSSSLPVLAFQGSMNLKARTKSFHACIDELQSIRNGVRAGKGQEGKVKEQGTGKRLLLGGRSMGARAAVIAASEHLAELDDEGGEMDVRLVLVSYPFRGPKDELRDQILFDLHESVSVLFVIGDRDAMCPLDLLHETRSKMSAKSQLVVVRGADHGMHIKPASLTKGLGEETGRVAARWVQGGLEEDITYIGEEEEEEEEEQE